MKCFDVFGFCSWAYEDVCLDCCDLYMMDHIASGDKSPIEPIFEDVVKSCEQVFENTCDEWVVIQTKFEPDELNEFTFEKAFELLVDDVTFLLECDDIFDCVDRYNKREEEKRKKQNG